MRTKLLVLLFCWVGMVGIKSGNACGKDKDENAVVLPVYERNGRMYVEIEQTYLGREWMVLAQIDRGLGIRGKLLESKGIFRLEQGRDYDQRTIYDRGDFQGNRTVAYGRAPN